MYFNLCGILVYFLSSLGGIAIVKFLNYRFCFTSWLLLALLSRATWILSLILHLSLQCFDKSLSKFSFPTASCYQLRLYLWIAIGLSVVELFNSLSMSMLPGSLYMLLKGSDVGWSMVLSYYLLDKRYNRKQVFAAMLIMTGVAMVFLLNDDSSYSSPNADVDADDTSYYPVTMTSAAALCLCGAFLNALCAVGTEATLKRSLREEENRLQVLEHQPSKLLLSNAYSMWTSFFSFSMLAMVPVSISFNSGSSIGKYFSLLENLNSTTCAPVSNLETPNPDSSSFMTTHSFLAISACLGLLSVSRFSERLSKHWICVSDSAMTFSIVQAARRLAGVYIIGILFGESFSVSMIVGSLCSGLGFVLHCWFSYISRPPRSDAESKRSHQYKYESIQTINAADLLSDVETEPTTIPGDCAVPFHLSQTVLVGELSKTLWTSIPS
jgi:hypothetical protein